MNIKPIKTTADYEAALKEIERLFDAEPGTPQGDRLEVLIKPYRLRTSSTAHARAT